jgi:hypothetical protein
MECEYIENMKEETLASVHFWLKRNWSNTTTEQLRDSVLALHTAGLITDSECCRIIDKIPSTDAAHS